MTSDRLRGGPSFAADVLAAVRNGFFLAGIGAVLGLGAAFALVTTLGRILPMIPGKDTWMIVGTAFLLVGVALFACWLPARRTTKISPTVALRAE